jgi:hypothetical protein
LRGLQAELDELERTDPAVGEARRLLDELPKELARYDRHMAARKAVGKRALPKELRRQSAAEEGKQ